MYGNNPAPPLKKAVNLTTHKVGVLLRELSEDEDEDKDKISDVGDVSSSQHALWHSDFHGYLNSRDQLGRMSIVEWWGICTKNDFPTLADFLEITVECKSVSCVGIPCSRLPCNNGIISFERAGVLICWHHNL